MNPDPTDSRERSESEPTPGWKALAIAASFYVLCVSIATWPRVLGFRTSLPSLLDPLQHLWILRWYRACLLEGQSFVVCPEIQFPTGVPLGCFSPMHFQALLFIPLSLAIPNDILCYNLIWLFGMVFTGLGTFVLAWRIIGDRCCAGFGGMLAMLSAPMMLHAAAHLELIYLGAFPLFLWTWLRLLDRPSRGRLAAAVGIYILVALCAAYYAVFTVFPAALYCLWKGMRSGRHWFRERGHWLLSFAALVVPGLLFVFGNQIWAMARGYALPRPFAEFEDFGAPLWGYAYPTWRHALGPQVPTSWYATTGLIGRAGECSSYLGVVTLGLLAYAAAFRVRCRDRSFWWACLVLVVVLSGGAAWTIAGSEITLPGFWLKKHFLLFRTIRAPARFNLYAAVVAAILAASGLRHLVARLPGRWMRGAVLAVLTPLAVADLAIVPYFGAEVPAMPGCYAFMERNAPGAAFVEVPQFGSGGSDLDAIRAYWQSDHRGRTTAGYCGQGNAIFDNLLTYNSPFHAESLARPKYLEDPVRTHLAFVGDVAFRDYAWLYLKAHDFRFAVLHKRPDMVPAAIRLDRLMSALAAGRVYEDETSVVYDRDRLPLPRHPVMITTGGWRLAQERSALRVIDRQARVLLYNPDPTRDLRLVLDAKALHRPRLVRLVSEGQELAGWTVRPREYQALASPPFRLPAGLHRLVLESNGVSRPRYPREFARANDLGPYSLKVVTIELEAASSTLAHR